MQAISIENTTTNRDETTISQSTETFAIIEANEATLSPMTDAHTANDETKDELDATIPVNTDTSMTTTDTTAQTHHAGCNLFSELWVGESVNERAGV